MYLDLGLALDAGLGCQIRQVLKSRDEFRAAIGIAGVIDGVNAYEDAGRAGNLCVGEGEGQKNSVAGRDVCHGDAGGHLRLRAIFRDTYVAGKGGAAEGAKVEADDAVFLRAKLFGDLRGGVHFNVMTLAVVERKAITSEAFLAGDGETSGRIEAATEQTDGGFFRGVGQISV